jgi:copper(I)-binding protein
VPKGASVAAGYLTMKNTGTTPDHLVSASTPVAGKVEIHQMTMENGIMRPVAGVLKLRPVAQSSSVQIPSILDHARQKANREGKAVPWVFDI